MTTASHYAFNQYVMGVLTANKTTLGLFDVFYGDQNLLPGSPVVCVEPDTKATELKNATRGVDVYFRTYVLVYVSFVASPEDNRKAADQLAEAIETLLNADAQCGGLVIHSMVEELTSGYATKSGTIVRASRILFTGRSVSRLPS
jgi:hypothetical protein